MTIRARITGLACGLALWLALPLSAEPFFPEARAAMRAAKTVRIEVELKFPRPESDMGGPSEEDEDEKKNSPKQPAKSPFLQVNLPLAEDIGKIFRAMGLRPVADGPADFALRVKAEGKPIEGTYHMIGTQYAGAELSGHLTFLLDNREFADTEFEFTYDRPNVVVVTTYGGMGIGSGPYSQPESAPFHQTLPAVYRVLLEFAGRGLGAETVARTLQVDDPDIKAAACLALGDLAEPEAGPALLKACNDPQAAVRAAAAWALRELKNPAAIPALLAGLGKFDEFPAAERRADNGMGPSAPAPEEVEESEQARWNKYLSVISAAPDEIFQREFGEQGFARPYVLGALVALARDNADGPSLLRAALKSGPRHQRSGAAVVLGELKVPEAHDDLVASLAGDQWMQMAALEGLGLLADARSLPAIFSFATEMTGPVRVKALDTLDNLERQHGGQVLAGGANAAVGQEGAAHFYRLPPESPPLLQWLALNGARAPRTDTEWRAVAAALVHPHPLVRRRAATKLGQEPPDLMRPALEAALADKETEVRRGALEALLKMSPPLAPEKLLPLARHADAGIKALVMSELEQVAGPEALAALRNGLKDPDEEVRRAAAGALGQHADPAATQVLLALLNDNQWTPAWSKETLLLEALGERHDPKAVEAVLALLVKEEAQKSSEDTYISEISMAASSALQAITGQEFESAQEWRTWWRANRERLLAAPGK